MSENKSLFVAATRQNDGKTMVTMGLFHALKKRFDKVGYIKPVGQQYKMVNGDKIDKDAVLFHRTYNLSDPLVAMSPIAVPSGFTHKYILRPDPDTVHNQIKKGYDIISRENDMVICEGTGHAGVGSVIDASNADVAKLLGTKVVLVSLGGIGRSIDEIMLNKACFDLKGVEILGVIMNKIKPDKYEKVTTIAQQGFERLGLKVLGMIPFVDMLTYPSVLEVQESLDAEILNGKDNLHKSVEKYIIGAMQPEGTMSHLTRNTLLIVPADREDMIIAALGGESSITQDQCFVLSGIVFSAGIRPSQRILDIIKQSPIPTLFVEDDSFTISTKINKMLVKLRHNESEKIQTIQQLVEDYVDVDYICQQL